MSKIANILLNILYFIVGCILYLMIKDNTLEMSRGYVSSGQYCYIVWHIPKNIGKYKKHKTLKECEAYLLTTYREWN